MEPIRDEAREEVIRQALESPEGRMSLAIAIGAAMHGLTEAEYRERCPHHIERFEASMRKAQAKIRKTSH